MRLDQLEIKLSKLITMRSPAGAGKSTWANQYRLDNPNTVIVNRDTLRYSLYGVYYGPPIDEDFITTVQDSMIGNALRQGYDVVVDDCNLSQRYINRFAYLAWEHDAEFKVQEINVPLDVILSQNAGRDRQVPENVIEKMFQQSLKKYEIPEFPKVKPYVPNLSLSPTFQFDIDGCVALKGPDRGYYDWQKVDCDILNDSLAQIIWALEHQGFKIIFLSGRDEECRSLTEWWLDTYLGIEYKLFMRTCKDQRKDAVVKLELFNEYVRNNYNVLGIYDDRPVMNRLWTRLNVPVYQIGDQHVEF